MVNIISLNIFSRIFKLFFIISLCFVCFVNYALATEELIFHDDFNDLNQWNVESGDQSIILANPGMYTNYSVDSFNTTFSINKIPFPDADIHARVIIRAVDGSYVQGAGVVFNDTNVIHGFSWDPWVNEIIVGIWPNNQQYDWGLPSAYCSTVTCFASESPYSVILSTESKNWQQLDVFFTSNDTSFSVNGGPLYIADTIQRRPRFVWIGNPKTTTTQQSGFALFQVDKVDVWKVLPNPTPTPTLTPTPTSTPTPTPTPSSTPAPTPIGFTPYYSQKDPLWASDIYDSAQVWSPGKTGIDRYGCALSSAAMVLSKYGIKSPTGAVSTPKVLNEWLKVEKDGYVGEGLINWIAVTRYSKAAEKAGQAPHALEYTKDLYSNAGVNGRLAEGKYPILGYNGHFVLAHKADGNDWVCADPLRTSDTKLANKLAINKVNIFSPSHTDLSYMMFVGPKGTTFEMNGLAVDTEQIADDISGGSRESVVATYAKPAAGTYQLKVSGKGKWTSYLYDNDGTVAMQEWAIDGCGKNEYIIGYDPAPGATSTIAVKAPESKLEAPRLRLAEELFGRVILDWSPVKSATRYEVRYGTSATNLDKKIAVKNVTWKQIEGLRGTYYFGVVAFDKNGTTSAISNIKKVNVHKWLWHWRRGWYRE